MRRRGSRICLSKCPTKPAQEVFFPPRLAFARPGLLVAPYHEGMIKAPALPSGYQDIPVTPSEAQTARNSVAQNGQRLQTALNVLMAYNLLSVLLAIGLPLWFQQALRDLLNSMGEVITPSDRQELQRLTPGWLWLLLGLLYALIPVVNLWCLAVVKKAQQAVQTWVLEPTTDGGEEVSRRLLTVRPWITLGQWLPIIGGVLIMLFDVGLFVAVGSGDSGMGEAAFGFLFSMLFYLLPLAAMAVLTWLFLGAVKRWLHAVITRTTQPNFPVRPFARSLDGWLIFLLVVIILGVLNAAASTLMLLFFPALMSTIMATDPTLQADAEVFQLISKWMQGFALLSLLGVVVYVLLAFATHWTRLFTGDVARVLDAGRPVQPQPQQVIPAVSNDW